MTHYICSPFVCKVIKTKYLTTLYSHFNYSLVLNSVAMFVKSCITCNINI